jgi:tyrosine phenol-lyase
MYFTTTRLHQELAGGTFVDVIIDEAHDPENEHPFKGNVDLDKLQKVIDEHGADKIPYICIATAVNMAAASRSRWRTSRDGRARARTASSSCTT